MFKNNVCIQVTTLGLHINSYGNKTCFKKIINNEVKVTLTVASRPFKVKTLVPYFIKMNHVAVKYRGLAHA